MRRQYDAVDPDNRLVASELERRWNTALVAVKAIEDELETLVSQRPDVLGEEERQRLLDMGADLEAAWQHPSATPATRKRIIRAVLHEIVVRIEDDQIQLLLHWQGGDHTPLTIRKNRTGKHRWAAEPATEELIRALARVMPDRAMASLLNRAGKKTGRLDGWTQSRVCTFRNRHDIAVYKEGERAARGEITLDETADLLGCSPMTALRLIRTGVLAANHHCKGAPWIIKREDVVAIAEAGILIGARKRPLSPDPDQQALVFQ